ncbi:MAG: OmpA family protein [Myxococcales bacterium]|nr:OmpA family protein [Myxococcales bacterium]
MKTRSTALVIAAIGLLILAGCTTTSDTTDDMSGAETSPETGSEFSQGETPVANVVAESSATLGTAYFDYDSAEIRGMVRDVLKANAEILQRTKASATIEGHADERGSEEYNLALGERRAESVRNYLKALGVSGSKLHIISYGEARPAGTGHDEASWKLNRRAEFHTR